MHKQVENDLIAIMSRGRAAGVAVWLCTQRPTNDVITGVIKANLSAKIALHTNSKQDSINIIGEKYAADLPAYGFCEYYTPDTMTITRWPVPLIPAKETSKALAYWRYMALNPIQKIIYKILKGIKIK